MTAWAVWKPVGPLGTSRSPPRVNHGGGSVELARNSARYHGQGVGDEPAAS